MGFRRKRKNRYKNKRIKKKTNKASVIKNAFKLIFFVMFVSLACIFSYDALTQAAYFQTTDIEIINNKWLSKKDILKQADLKSEVNILSLSLAEIKKRLLAHPWIAQVDISRKLPNNLKIIIKERKALAVLEMAQKQYFIIDENGKIFKKLEASDPGNLVIIKGLEFYDISEQNYAGSLAFQSVIKVLTLSLQKDSILPYRVIKKICLDNETGITIIAFKSNMAIELGYDKYNDKYQRLHELLNYILKEKSIANFQFIDMKNMDRIVVRPCYEIAAGEEV
ncbi:cell division protein FtsQ [Candidatus Magnetomoraceae bacterium gMMP-15]